MDNNNFFNIQPPLHHPNSENHDNGPNFKISKTAIKRNLKVKII